MMRDPGAYYAVVQQAPVALGWSVAVVVAGCLLAVGLLGFAAASFFARGRS